MEERSKVFSEKQKTREKLQLQNRDELISLGNELGLTRLSKLTKRKIIDLILKTEKYKNISDISRLDTLPPEIVDMILEKMDIEDIISFVKSDIYPYLQLKIENFIIKYMIRNLFFNPRFTVHELISKEPSEEEMIDMMKLFNETEFESPGKEYFAGTLKNEIDTFPLISFDFISERNKKYIEASRDPTVYGNFEKDLIPDISLIFIKKERWYVKIEINSTAKYMKEYIERVEEFLKMKSSEIGTKIYLDYENIKYYSTNIIEMYELINMFPELILGECLFDIEIWNKEKMKPISYILVDFLGIDTI